MGIHHPHLNQHELNVHYRICQHRRHDGGRRPITNQFFLPLALFCFLSSSLHYNRQRSKRVDARRLLSKTMRVRVQRSWKFEGQLGWAESHAFIVYKQFGKLA